MMIWSGEEWKGRLRDYNLIHEYCDSNKPKYSQLPRTWPAKKWTDNTAPACGGGELQASGGHFAQKKESRCATQNAQNCHTPGH
jgi:hypothetical protein